MVGAPMICPPPWPPHYKSPPVLPTFTPFCHPTDRHSFPLSPTPKSGCSFISRRTTRMYTYADAGLLLLPFPPEPAPLHLRFPTLDDGFLRLFDTDFYSESYQMANLVCASTISDYDLGGEGNLFEALAPIMEEPELALDPMTAAAMSVISAGDDVITETIKAAAMEPINEDPLMSDVFYECKKEFLAMSASGEQISNVSDNKITPLQAENDLIEEENKLAVEGLIERSISDGCLNSVDWAKGCCTMRPNFLDFQGLDVQAAFGMRRAFSEGDIKILGNNNLDIGNKSSINSPFEPLSTINNIKAEERREKLSRYRKKKSKRDFGRKIKNHGLVKSSPNWLCNLSMQSMTIHKLSRQNKFASLVCLQEGAGG